MNKFSKYTYFLNINGLYFIYNLTNGQAIALNSKIYERIKSTASSIDKLNNIHPDLYKNLHNFGFVVDTEIDEEQSLIESFKRLDKNPEYFNIIVNPTLDCNLNCWYCYETHQKGSMMNQQVMDSLKKLIETKISDNKLKQLNVSFFGGEPLLGWNNVIYPLLSYAKTQCENRNITLSTGFTTNGVLLQRPILKKLAELGLEKSSFQISLDGNRQCHDKSRVGIGNKPTYDIIMNNILLALEENFNISLRFNYTPDNIFCFKDVIEDLKSIPLAFRENLRCNFQKIWQSGEKSENLKKNVFNYINELRDNGFNVGSDFIFHRHICYADNENSIVINYNGDLFKCTAREFSNGNRKGVLLNDGTLKWNDKYFKRMNIKYSNPLCLKCKILPICNGGCSTNKLEKKIPTTSCQRRTNML